MTSQLDIGVAEPPTGSLRNESLSINVTRVDSRYSLSDLADVLYHFFFCRLIVFTLNDFAIGYKKQCIIALSHNSATSCII